MLDIPEGLQGEWLVTGTVPSHSNKCRMDLICREIFINSVVSGSGFRGLSAVILA
jgi:hypothetical protein